MVTFWKKGGVLGNSLARFWYCTIIKMNEFVRRRGLPSSAMKAFNLMTKTIYTRAFWACCDVEILPSQLSSSLLIDDDNFGTDF